MSVPPFALVYANEKILIKLIFLKCVEDEDESKYNRVHGDDIV